VVFAALVSIAVACGGGDDDSGGVASTTASTASTVVTTQPTTAPATTAPTSEAPPAVSTAGDDATTTSTGAPLTTVGAALTAADVDAITSVFQVFFGGLASTLDEKVAVLEDGETYRAMLVAANENEQFQQMSTDIRDVRAGSDSECAELGAGAGCAVVTHDLLVGGFPMAAAVDSPAVRADGTWLVGAAAWCNAVAIGGASCPGDETSQTTEESTP
jgi:hypothetical protein